jgi:Zn-dependent peptidase ImmA (M78 family)
MDKILQKRKYLHDELKKALANNDVLLQQKILQDITNIDTKHYHIEIEYINFSPENDGRTIYVKESKTFIICLPRKLLEKSNNNEYDLKNIDKIKYITAHEIGHIVLHFDKLTESTDLIGSKKMSENDEIEAKIFAEELLKSV